MGYPTAEQNAVGGKYETNGQCLPIQEEGQQVPHEEISVRLLD